MIQSHNNIWLPYGGRWKVWATGPTTIIGIGRNGTQCSGFIQIMEVCQVETSGTINNYKF